MQPSARSINDKNQPPEKTTNGNAATTQANDANRRHSLFTAALSGGLTSHLNDLLLLGRGNEQPTRKDYSKELLSQMTSTSRIKPSDHRNRRPTIDAMTGIGSNICSRCKRIEDDDNSPTADASDLNDTETELIASRQVISLLQRQLELVQIEKDGLEQLVQSKSSRTTSAHSTHERDQALIEPLQEETECVESEANQSEKEPPLPAGLDSVDSLRVELYAKNEEILNLKKNLKQVQNEKEQLNLQIHVLEDDIKDSKAKINLLTENLALRDQTIVSLSNEVFEQSSINSNDYNSVQRRQSSADSFAHHRNQVKVQRQLSKMIDTVDAYKKTNELLNNKVVKLTDDCAQSEKREMETRSQCQELEAKCCQIQSKLLSLLKEIEQSSSNDRADKDNVSQENVICSESVKLLIKRLLEDKSLDIPLSWKEGNRPRQKLIFGANNSNQDCDELGFYLGPGDSLQQLEGRATKSILEKGSPTHVGQKRARPMLKRGMSECPDRLSYLGPVNEEAGSRDVGQNDHDQTIHPTVDSNKTDISVWRTKWDDFIKDFDKVDLSKSKEFKKLLRSGVPQEYRCKVWKSLVDLKVGKDRESYGPDYYQSLLDQSHLHTTTKTSADRKSGTGMLNPSSKQIELDLLRTLPNNKYFETIDSPGTVRLRRVLTAFSNHNTKVGYCQGMNRLAAVALLVLPEEEAFWCLCAIIDKIMPIGYYNDLWMTQVDSNVVMDFVAIKMPSLNDHFKQYSIELSLFAWFLTIFVDGTPPPLFLRLWDCFLYEGDKVMFRVALALLKMHENELIKSNSSVGVNNFLRSSVNAPMDIDSFFQIAFDWMNPLSRRSLRSKRQQNYRTLRPGFMRFADESNVSFDDVGACATLNSKQSKKEDETGDDKQDDTNDASDSPIEDNSVISI